MKSKLLALTLCLLGVSFAKMDAQPIKAPQYNFLKKQKLMCKGAGLPFFKASGSSVITLTGSTTATYTPLNFDRHQHNHGGSIKAQKNGSEFVLKKGFYLINFTGTFMSTMGDINTINLGIDVNGKVILVQTNAIEASFDNVQILTTSQVIHIEQNKSKVKIVAQDTSAGTSTNVVGRNISIIKLSDN